MLPLRLVLHFILLYFFWKTSDVLNIIWNCSQTLRTAELPPPLPSHPIPAHPVPQSQISKSGKALVYVYLLVHY